MSSYFSGFVSSMKSALGFENLEVVETGDQPAADAPPAEERQGLFKQLSQYIGKDVTSMVSLPVWIFEPHSFLQIMCEPLQFEELLKKASESPDSCNRLAYLAAFLAAGYSCASRTKKPFNPILGETFEFVSPDNQWKFLAEQVSHHPPIGVAETVSDSYRLHLEMNLKTKFKGNSAECTVHGNCYITFPKFDDYITWNHLDTCANNLIIGGTWIDHYGQLEINNHTTGDVCTVTFTRAGYFGVGRYEINGVVKNKEGNEKLRLNGKWNEVVYASKVLPDGTTSTPIILWKRTPVNNAASKWYWTKFNEDMNACPPSYEATLPMTDSRLRTDRRELERGNVDLAGKEKHRLEEKQRADRKALETKKEEYQSKYYQRVQENGTDKWIPVGNYWEEREERIKMANQGASSTSDSTPSSTSSASSTPAATSTSTPSVSTASDSTTSTSSADINTMLTHSAEVESVQDM